MIVRLRQVTEPRVTSQKAEVCAVAPKPTFLATLMLHSQVWHCTISLNFLFRLVEFQKNL